MTVGEVEEMKAPESLIESQPWPNAVCPVPPFKTASVPVTSVPTLTSAVATTPAVALRKPVRFARRNAEETTKLVVDAVPETWSAVVVAFVEVLLVKIAVEGVVAPIGVESIVPPEMVRLSATCASVAEPMRLVKLMLRELVATHDGRPDV